MDTLSIYSVADIVAQRGCDRRTVARAAKRLGIPLTAGRYLFDRPEAARILAEIREASGCPKFVKGNKLGRGRKKFQKKPS